MINVIMYWLILLIHFAQFIEVSMVCWTSCQTHNMRLMRRNMGKNRCRKHISVVLIAPACAPVILLPVQLRSTSPRVLEMSSYGPCKLYVTHRCIQNTDVLVASSPTRTHLSVCALKSIYRCRTANKARQKRRTWRHLLARHAMKIHHGVAFVVSRRQTKNLDFSLHS